MRALITGANSLVNKAFLSRLVALEYDVTAHYHSDNRITQELKATYPKVHFVEGDFASKAGIGAFMDQVKGVKYDVLVNGAVYYAEAKGWEPQADWSAWQKTFAVNTTAAGMLMAETGSLVGKGGVVVNISSTYGQPYMGDIQFAMYSASKAALDSLTMTYAKRWSPNVRVVGIAPGWVRSAWNKDMSQQDIKAMISPQLTHKFIDPEELADLMEVVITNKSINATTLVIDGGLDAPII